MNTIICFAPIELYYVNREKEVLYRFAIVDNLPGLLDILQLVLDGCTTGLDDVVGLDTLSGKYFKVAPLAARHGMRKRTFYEKLDNIKTYSLEVIA